MNRRSLLRTGAAVAGGSLFSVSSAGADEEDSWASVSVYDHFEVSPLLQTSVADGYTEYGYDVTGPLPGYQEGPSPEAVLVIPNAWWVLPEWFRGRIDSYRQNLELAGYDGAIIPFEWESADNPALWRVTAEKARLAGKKLGAFLEEYRTRNPETEIRLLGHSLAAEVVLAAIGSLEDRGWEGQLQSISLLGASVDHSAPSLDGEYGDALAERVDQVDNFHKTDDNALAVYPAAAFDTALGRTGIDGPAPENYTDHRVDYVSGHDAYWSYEDGCMGAVVDQWGDDRETDQPS
jgi:hypothetical protein